MKKHSVKFFTVIALIGLTEAGQAQICGPTYSAVGGTSVYIGTTGCGAVPGAGRLQVQGGTGSSFNYAANFLAPISLTQQNYALYSTSGISGSNSGYRTTGGKFQGFGGTHFINGSEAYGRLDFAGYDPNVKVRGMLGQAESTQAMTGTSTLVGVESQTVLTGAITVANAYGVNAELGTLGNSGTVTNAYGCRAVLGNYTSYNTAIALSGLVNATSAASIAAFGQRGEVAVNVTTPISYGNYGLVRSGTTRFGVRGEATADGVAGGQAWYGVYGKVGDPGAPVGVPPYSTNAYAIYGVATTRTPFGVGLTANNTNSYAGWFDGHVWCNGISASSSDARIKSNIEPLKNNLELLLKVRPASYEYNHEAHPSMNLPYGQQMGVIAQELEKVLPQLVLTTQVPDQFDSENKLVEKSFELKGVNYLGLIPVLIGGMQEQQTEIAEQKAVIEDKQIQIDALNERLALLEQKLGVDPSGSVRPTKAHLEQNSPNPFDESTVIRYFIPSGSPRSMIQVYTADGKPWRTFEGLTPGQGQLVITAGSMAAGNYSYTLWIGTEKVDTKSMVITR